MAAASAALRRVEKDFGIKWFIRSTRSLRLSLMGDLLSGKVKPLLTDYPSPLIELWLICPSRQLITPALRKLREHMQTRSAALLAELQAAGFIP